MFNTQTLYSDTDNDARMKYYSTGEIELVSKFNMGLRSEEWDHGLDYGGGNLRSDGWFYLYTYAHKLTPAQRPYWGSECWGWMTETSVSGYGRSWRYSDCSSGGQALVKNAYFNFTFGRIQNNAP